MIEVTAHAMLQAPGARLHPICITGKHILSDLSIKRTPDKKLI